MGTFLRHNFVLEPCFMCYCYCEHCNTESVHVILSLAVLYVASGVAGVGLLCLTQTLWKPTSAT